MLYCTKNFTKLSWSGWIGNQWQVCCCEVNLLWNIVIYQDDSAASFFLLLNASFSFAVRSQCNCSFCHSELIEYIVVVCDGFDGDDNKYCINPIIFVATTQLLLLFIIGALKLKNTNSKLLLLSVHVILLLMLPSTITKIMIIAVDKNIQ